MLRVAEQVIGQQPMKGKVPKEWGINTSISQGQSPHYRDALSDFCHSESAEHHFNMFNCNCEYLGYRF
jgi:hypothetical protein